MLIHLRCWNRSKQQPWYYTGHKISWALIFCFQNNELGALCSDNLVPWVQCESCCKVQRSNSVPSRVHSMCRSICSESCMHTSMSFVMVRLHCYIISLRNMQSYQYFFVNKPININKSEISDIHLPNSLEGILKPVISHALRTNPELVPVRDSSVLTKEWTSLDNI